MARSTDDPSGDQAGPPPLPKPAAKPDAGYEVLPEEDEPEERYGREVRRRLRRSDRRRRPDEWQPVSRSRRSVGRGRSPVERALGIVCAAMAGLTGLIVLAVFVALIVVVVNEPVAILGIVFCLPGLALAPAWAYYLSVANDPEEGPKAWWNLRVVFVCSGICLVLARWWFLSIALVGLEIVAGAMLGRTAWQVFTGRLTEKCLYWTMVLSFIIAGSSLVRVILVGAILVGAFVWHGHAWLLLLVQLIAAIAYRAAGFLANYVRQRI